MSFADIRCQNLEDVLGGFGRSFQTLATRDVTDAFSEGNPLIVNTGILTGTNVMTGLRTYFSAYSPLKVSGQGLPAAMWSAGSGKFGSKLKWSGVDEVVIERRAARPPDTGHPRHRPRPNRHAGTGRAAPGTALLREDPGAAR